MLDLRSVEKICFQGPQVLQMAFTGMCPKYSEIHLLVVCTISQTLAIINMAVLRSLVAEVLGPQKQDISYFMKNTVSFFKIPALDPSCSVWHVFLEQVKQFH